MRICIIAFFIITILYTGLSGHFVVAFIFIVILTVIMVDWLDLKIKTKEDEK